MPHGSKITPIDYCNYAHECTCYMSEIVKLSVSSMYCTLIVRYFLHMHMLIIDEGTCATCVVLLECFMLNCLSQKSICEVDLEEHQVLLSLLFKHLEYIPDLQNPQHMVKESICAVLLCILLHLSLSSSRSN